MHPTHLAAPVRAARLLPLLLASHALGATPGEPPEKPPLDAPACPSSEERPDVVTLVKRTEQLLQGRTSTGVMVMTIKTPSWTRRLKLKLHSQGQDYALIRVLEGGPRETGMMTLKREKQLWNYLPQAGRVMKLPSGMLGDSWMGSDFTNDDLVKGSSLTRDFDSRVEGTIDLPADSAPTGKAARAWRIVLVPKKDAAVVWGKVELDVDRASCLPVLERFYDEEGKLARQLAFSGFRELGWRRFPARMTVTSGAEGRETSVFYESIEFDVDIPEDTFSLHRLQQGR